MWAVGIIAAIIAGIALSGLYASTAVGGRVDANSKDIAYIQRDQAEVKKQMRWQRNALRAIAGKVGAELPEED
jgi:hypothetical protein